MFDSHVPLSITISDDQSVANKVEERRLTALRAHLPDHEVLSRTEQHDQVMSQSPWSMDHFHPPVPGPGALAAHEQHDQVMSQPPWLMEHFQAPVPGPDTLAAHPQQIQYKLPVQHMHQPRHAHIQRVLGMPKTARPETEAKNQQAMSMLPPLSASLASTRKRPREADATYGKKSGVEEMDLEELQSYIQRLQSKVKAMGNVQTDEPYFRNHTFYRILKRSNFSGEDGPEAGVLSPAYFDRPEWSDGQGGAGSLRCSVPVNNLDLYLERNKDICSIVYHTYVEPTRHEMLERTRRRSTKPYVPTVNVSISPLGRELKDAVATALEEADGCSKIVQALRTTAELTAPYTFYFHHCSVFQRVAENLDTSTERQLRLLMDHIMQTEGSSHRAAEAVIAQGRITPRTMTYLFKPGDTFVFRQGDEYTGWIATDWPKKKSTDRETRSEANKQVTGIGNGISSQSHSLTKNRNDDVMLQQWVVSAWQWHFDGAFRRKNETITWYIQQEISDNEDENFGGELPPETTQAVLIAATMMVPLRFCSSDIVDKLRNRGHTFWKCRQRRFVSYLENDSDTLPQDNRYMIDLKTYRDLHKDNAWNSGFSPRAVRDGLGEEAMKRDECPEEEFELLLPLRIKGFHLQRKKWYDLMVDRISDVVWAKEAFSKIVMDPKAKEIVRALISKQLASERSTDLVAGKGNGLILLLHGGPGTGKTLTAESVAEIAEKPLYRVTCGDVGTKAEAVEKYLESVFHLGKRWGCVVLLDEADVFLEQRDLKDLERNALVSVFLRVLEYYEGILILTSNRVGTFDEAFRSRIQLALHYPTLTQFQRLRIWENFIDRLETFKDGAVNITDLKYHLDDLSKREMNGREIRNVITTARQYAEYMGTTLTYAQLADVIDISTRFDTYLGQLHGGLTREEIAKDEGIR